MSFKCPFTIESITQYEVARGTCTPVNVFQDATLSFSSEKKGIPDGWKTTKTVAQKPIYKNKKTGRLDFLIPNHLSMTELTVQIVGKGFAKSECNRMTVSLRGDMITTNHHMFYDHEMKNERALQSRSKDHIWIIMLKNKNEKDMLGKILECYLRYNDRTTFEKGEMVLCMNKDGNFRRVTFTPESGKIVSEGEFIFGGFWDLRQDFGPEKRKEKYNAVFANAKI